jgi:hypothetical protein
MKIDRPSLSQKEMSSFGLMTWNLPGMELVDENGSLT